MNLNNQPEKASRSVISTGWLVTFIILAVIIADQALKIYVKTSFYFGESYEIFPWFELKFIENNGMAFGMELWSKLALTFGRIAVVAVLIWFVYKWLKAGAADSAKRLKRGYMVAMALIIAGAAGNIFDCVLYGEIFNNPMPPETASFVPLGEGYSTWFEGRVVDMLYFPICSWTWPEWVPGIGGQPYEFFQYIFNLADSSICIGVGLLIFFYSDEASRAFTMLGRKEGAGSDNANEKNA